MVLILRESYIMFYAVVVTEVKACFWLQGVSISVKAELALISSKDIPEGEHRWSVIPNFKKRHNSQAL